VETINRNRVESAGNRAGQAREFLAFKLDEEEYGLDIQQIQEIRMYEPVMNLRGTIIPIMDLRIQFQIGTPTYDENTVVIVTCVDKKAAGFIVDSVTEVTAIPPEQMHAAPELGGAATRYITGLGTVGERTLILVDARDFLAN
jgi:purine-binding chemotaxis protein CheW